jgi:anti-sigma factor RsiW
VTYAEGGTGSVGSDYGRSGGRAVSVEIAELTHDDIRGQLSDYVEDALDPGQAARVAAHVRQCAACAAYLATLRATIDLLGALPTKTAPERLRQRLLAVPDDAPAPDAPPAPA